MACLLVGGYVIHTTARIRQLEARIHQPLLPQPAPQLTHAFDDSFMQNFGQRGVAIVEAAVQRGVTDPDEITRELQREPGLRYEVR